MDTQDLQTTIARLDAAHATAEDELVASLVRKAIELDHITDPVRRQVAAGEVALALIRLCNQRGWDLAELVEQAAARRPTVGRNIALIGTSASPITNTHCWPLLRSNCMDQPRTRNYSFQYSSILAKCSVYAPPP